MANGTERIRFGKILVKTGHLTEAELPALTQKRRSDEELDQTLVRLGRLTEAQIYSAVATHYGLTYIDLDSSDLDATAAAAVTEQQARNFRCMPVRLSAPNELLLAVSNPVDYSAKESLEFKGLRVRYLVAGPKAIQEAIAATYGTQENIEDILTQIPTSAELELVQGQPEGSEAEEKKAEVLDLRQVESQPVMKCVNAILREAIACMASDVHIEPSTSHVRVRYRVDGVLNPAHKLPRWVHPILVARIKVLGAMDIAERRVPQDGRFRLRVRRSEVDVRVSTLPTQHGEKVVMRLLDPNRGVSRLETLGFSPGHEALLREAIRAPQGAILVTGPTGSGKSSTLFAALREIAGAPVNIVTIENPIEYEVAGLNQVQVNEKAGLTFATALRSILRQDPNVVLVGEIRDRETAEIAFQAAMTGHLVLSTLHTNDAPSAVSRLMDLAVPPFLVASALTLVVAQRLVRRICDDCKTPVKGDPEMLRKIGLATDGVYFRGKGCAACGQSGYRGRTVVAELLPIDERMKELIAGKATEGAIRRAMRALEVPSILEDAARKVRLGLTTAEEIVRVVELPASSLACACGEALEPDFTACPMCGAEQNGACPGCAQPIQPGWVVCPYCRARLPATARAVEPRGEPMGDEGLARAA